MTEAGSERFCAADCGDAGRGPRAEECGQSLEGRKSKEKVFFLGPPGGILLWQYLDFNPVISVSVRLLTYTTIICDAFSYCVYDNLLQQQ